MHVFGPAMKARAPAGRAALRRLSPTITCTKSVNKQMDSFSWSDSIRATLGTCLPCIKPANDASDDDEPQRRRRGALGAGAIRQPASTAREELERLLDQPVSSDEDVETMSLHSNVGRRRAKRSSKNKRVVKTVRLFGVDLFGRRDVASTSANDDEEQEERRAARRNRRPRAISTSTLDSDAAPLADEQITDFTTRANQRWAPTHTDEELAVEERRERERIEKEMRREERKERKALKKLAQQGAFAGEDEEFEGFPGSGAGVVVTPRRGSSSIASPAPDAGAADEFGPFVAGSQASTHQRTASEDREEEEADFDAAAYTKKSRAGGDGSQSGSGSHSRSRSRTSASLSADGSTTRPKPGRSPQPSPLGQEFNGPSSPKPTSVTPRKKKEKKDHTRAKPSKSSLGSSTATPSLPSPKSSPALDVKIHSQDFDGVPGGLVTPRDHLNAFAQSSMPSPSFPSAGFPSTGFGGFKRSTSGLSGNAGVALARRGDD